MTKGNTTMDTNNEQGLNAADFLGNYLKKEDLGGDTAVRIVDVRAETLPGAEKTKLVAKRIDECFLRERPVGRLRT